MPQPSQHLIAVQTSRAADELYAQLGITPAHIAACKLSEQVEPLHVVAVDRDILNRLVTLRPDAAAAWKDMKSAAMADNIELNAESGFRSAQHQANIIQAQLNAGKTIDQILTRAAPPYRSEHNAGLAVDIANNASLIHDHGESFEHTASFAWLKENAGKFGFHLSYPRDNASGIIYEPWHWCYEPETTAQVTDLSKASF